MVYYLFTAQLLAHLSVIPMILYAKPHHYAISLFVYFLMGGIGMSITFHRMICHESFVPKSWFKVFGLFCANIGLTGSAVTWAAVHRVHHNHSDTEKDPHSPKIRSPLWVQYLSMFYRPATLDVRPFVKDPVARFFHRYYFHINLLYGLVLCLIDPFMLVYAFLFPAAILWNCSALVNNVGHLVGYRNFHTKDHSKNNPLLALITWGEGWHNNHHRYPRRSNFGQRWFEFDISYWIIRLVQRETFAPTPRPRPELPTLSSGDHPARSL